MRVVQKWMTEVRRDHPDDRIAQSIAWP